jgi:hypothetical protein
MEIVRLNLPKLPTELVTKIRLISNLLAHNNQSREWINNFHNNQINAVNYHSEFLIELQDSISSLYAEYFKDPILASTIILRNATGALSVSPPHCDRGRYTVINYLIDSGGEDVQTHFYDHIRTNDVSAAENLNYNQVKLTNRYRLEEGNWYCWNAQQCHSVEQLETLRIFLVLIVETNPTFNEVCNTYSNLIVEEVACLN